MNKFLLSVGKERLAIVQLKPGEKIPDYGNFGNIWSIIRTPDEISLIFTEELAHLYQNYEKGWRYLKINGHFDFNQIGVLSSILNPLATGNISILTFSTYDTDYILVKDENLEKAKNLLIESGHSIKIEQ